MESLTSEIGPGASNRAVTRSMAARTADEAFNLASLIHELPDPERELFIEHSQDTDTFPLLKKLPLELRLQIWRATFPGPRCIALSTLKKFGRSFQNKMARKHGKLPVAFFVCVESRLEASKTYSVLLRQNSRGEALPILSIDTKRDVGVIFWQDLWLTGPSNEDENDLYHWRGLKPAIEVIEIRDVRWRVAHKEYFEVTINEPVDFLRYYILFDKDYAFNFPGLKKLTFSVSNHEKDFTLAAAEITEEMTAILESKKEKFVSGKVPEIVVLPSSPQRQASA